MTVKAQIHRPQSPDRKTTEVPRKISMEYGARKISNEKKLVDRKSSASADVKRSSSNKSNVQNNFTNVLSELKNRKSSVDSNLSNSSNNKGVPPPPPMPPPLESHDPSESRPFLDPYGRAKTVRIGKWRLDDIASQLPILIQKKKKQKTKQKVIYKTIFNSLRFPLRWPPPSDSNENQSQDSFIEFKMRQQQQQRKITPHYQEFQQNDVEPVAEGTVEWEEFEIENIVGNEERTMVAHPSAGVVNRHENGHKEEGEKKKKKSK